MAETKRVRLYDPVRDAYYDVDLATAKKYLLSLEEVRKAVAAAEEKAK